MCYFPSSRPSKKLDVPTNSPFKIIKKVYNSFQLQLPDSIKVYNIFLTRKLYLYLNNLLPG